LELIHSITSPPQLFPYISLGEMEAYVISMLTALHLLHREKKD
jgi:hypothetical protein